MKKVWSFAALLVMLFTLAQCKSKTEGASGQANQTGATGAKGRKIAYSSVGDPNPWFLAFSAELEKEAKKRGYDFRVTHAQAKVEKQIADVEDIIAQKPDYLLLGPIDTTGSAPALGTAKKSNIPVVVVNRDIKGTAGADYVTKIYSDFEWIGAKMAELIHDAFPADTKAIKVVELHGTPGGGNTIGLQKGFRKKMAEYPNMSIVASQLGNYSRATAMKSIENIIQSGVEFNAVVGHSDEEAIASIQALQAAGKLGKEPKPGEIVIVGCGGTKDGIKAIQAGHYHKLVSVSPYYSGQVFDAIEAHAKGEKLPEYIRVEDVVIDKSNVEKYVSFGF